MRKPKIPPAADAEEAPRMEIETLRTAELIPYARNSRTHSEAQVAQIAGSIREFGFTNPVLIDAENGIVAGHGRVMAAQVLGMETVPCLRLVHLTKRQLQAYIIADNKLALNAGWDDDLLGLELAELREFDFDLGLLGFDAEGIEAILNPPEPGGPPDEPPEGDFSSQYAVTVICSGEDEQRKVFDRLTAEGLTCKVVCV